MSVIDPRSQNHSDYQTFGSYRMFTEFSSLQGLEVIFLLNKFANTMVKWNQSEHVLLNKIMKK